MSVTTTRYMTENNVAMEEVQGVTWVMDICGRVSSSPTKELRPIPSPVQKVPRPPSAHSQSSEVVMDALAALEGDVKATTEVLRQKHAPSAQAVPIEKPKPKPVEYQVQYKLRMSPVQPEMRPSTLPFPPRRRSPAHEDRCSVERICQDYGINLPSPSLKKRARSETPMTGRVIQIEGTPSPSNLPICAACGKNVEGACITACAPNSPKAMKFHPKHFVCTYCQKALNLRGTYREHERKPYCHECFYRLYSGHVYVIESKK